MQIHPHLQNARGLWSKATAYDKAVFGLALAGLTLGGGYLIWRHNMILPDQFFLFALVGSVLIGRTRTFLRDWLPLVALLLGYEYVRGLVPVLNGHVHFQTMIDFDRLFGDTIPTCLLQARYYVEGSIQWYDYAAVTLYLLHFIVPLGVAFLFWLGDRGTFKRYAAGFLILSYAAYATYLVFPAAPPWLAAQVGLTPPVHRILAATMAQLSDPISLPTVYGMLGVNAVAAVPSLHAAFPLLTSLFVVERIPKLLPLFAVYVLGVWIAVVYLGEHYVFDVATGAAYAVAAYTFLIYWPAIRKRLFRGKPSAEFPQAATQ
jgi:hypothetical protein